MSSSHIAYKITSHYCVINVGLQKEKVTENKMIDLSKSRMETRGLKQELFTVELPTGLLCFMISCLWDPMNLLRGEVGSLVYQLTWNIVPQKRLTFWPPVKWMTPFSTLFWQINELYYFFQLPPFAKSSAKSPRISAKWV